MPGGASGAFCNAAFAIPSGLELKQLVTVRTATGETARMMDVSPHLTVQKKIDVDPKRDNQATLNSAVDQAVVELSPIHDGVARVADGNH